MWLVFAIITTLTWGLAELFYKKGAKPNEKYSHLKICICVGIVMGIHAIYVLLTSDIKYDPINIIKYAPVSILYIVSMVCSYFGMRFLEESISDPIENTSGAICSILCFIFLGQTLTRMSFVGIILIVLGIISIGILENKRKEKRSDKIGKKLAIVSFAMPFLYAILDALGSFFDAFFLEISTTPLVGVTEDTIELVANTSYELSFLLVAIVLIIFMIVKKEKINLPHQTDKWLAAIFETAGQFTYVFAMSGSAIIAAPIISSVCAFSVLFSRIFLKEKLTYKQYLTIFVIILGILTLAVAETI